MRTRLAAGSVAAAALLTLFGGNVAGADDTTNHARAKADPVPAYSQQAQDDTEPAQESRRRPPEQAEWLKDSPVRLTACALGTAVSQLTGVDDSCVHERLGIPYEHRHGKSHDRR